MNQPAPSSPAPRVLVLFAPGFEEIEMVTVVDVLRRAACDVTLAGTGEEPLEGAHGILVTPDRSLTGLVANDFEALVLPGGMPNAQTLARDAQCQRLIREAWAANLWIGAICAAPIALAAAGLVEGKRLTSHPGVEDQLSGSRYESDRVVRDGRLLTSRGPGTALEFALALVEALVSPTRADQLAAPMLARR